MHDRDRAQAVDNEVAVLVRVFLDGDHSEHDPLDELEGLATTAGAMVAGGMTQRREKAGRHDISGKGKSRRTSAVGGIPCRGRGGF